MKITSSMAGVIVEVRVSLGGKVKEGDEVIILESMKMEIPITSTSGGTVTKIHKAQGDFVNEGDTLLELSP